MKVVVTGGAGFIGSHLVELLLSQHYEVTVIDNLSAGRLENLRTVESNPSLKFEQVDICDIESLSPLFEGVDWVFHLAGLADIVPSIEKPADYYHTNVTGTFNVLECSRKCGVKRIIYAASSSSYGIPEVYPTPESCPNKPEYPYALTKAMGEDLVLHWSKLYKLPAVSLRMFNVYGPRSRTTGAYGAVFGVFLAQKLAGRPFTVVGDGTQTRDFTYVSDVVNAYLCAARSDVSGVAMNVGSGNHYSINSLVEILGGAVEYIPKRPGEPNCTFADTKKIKEMLGWQPTVSFKEGVQKLLDNIEDWEGSPVWDTNSINKATEVWFDCLGEDKA